MLGWNICRVWTLDWWENSAEVFSTIENAINDAKNGIVEFTTEPKKVSKKLP
jgi:hypothetical protein